MAPESTERATDAQPAADAWFTPGRFALILTTLIVACFPGVVFGFETFWTRDFSGFAYPLAFYTRERLLHGEIPLWNPLNCCGLPFLAQWNTLVLYPGSWFCVIFPVSWSLGIFCLGHLLLAGMGMYFLARRWTGNGLAASAAGVIFAFNGLTWSLLMGLNNTAAIAWMPWVVLALEKAWAGGRRQTILAGLAGAMQMLTGVPETILLTWLFAGTLALLHWFRADVPRTRICLRFGTAAALTAGLAAAQLLPFLDLLAHSSRDTGYAISSETAQWAMPVGGWANYLVPLFHYYKVSYGGTIFYQLGQYWTASYFLGVGAILLALLALVRASRDHLTWLLVGLTIICLVLTLGDHGYLYAWLLRLVPALGFVRYPVKFVLLPTLTIPLLAGIGLARYLALPEKESRAGRKSMGWLTLLLLVAMTAIVWRAWEQPGPRENPWDTTWNALARAGFLLAILVCLALLRRAPGLQIQVLLGVGLLLLFWFDVFTHQPQLSPTIEPAFYAPNIVRPALNWDNELQPGQSRAMQTWRAYRKLYDKTGTNVEEDMNIRRVALLLNRNLLDNIAKTDGFYSLELRPMHELFQAIATSTNDLSRLEDFLGVAEISNPADDKGWAGRDTFRPMITAGEQPVFADDSEVLRGLSDGTLDSTRFVYLPPEAKTTATATAGADAKILRQDFAAEQLDAEVESSGPAWVVVAQAFYHPWRADVDGRPVKLWRANYAFQAVEVPAGRHVVKLVYRDQMFAIGSIISAATLATGLIGWARGRKVVASR